MASITVTDLANGITANPLVGMACINGGVPAYLYWDTIGDIYYQADAATPATLLLSAGFAITCIDTIFDGMAFNIFMGGVGGNYIWGTVDLTGVSTLSVLTHGTTDFTACAFNIMSWSFIVGTIDGNLLNFDLNSGIVSTLETLTSTLISGTLKISTIKYDLIEDKLLILGVGSNNLNPDYSDPIDVAAKELLNFSIVYYGVPTSLISTEFIGKNLPLGAIGWVENATGVKELKLVIAGEDCKIYNSNAGSAWVRATLVDQALALNSLTFNTWIFVAGLQYGIILMSTNGNVWESSYNALISNDIIDVKNS